MPALNKNARCSARRPHERLAEAHPNAIIPALYRPGLVNLVAPAYARDHAALLGGEVAPGIEEGAEVSVRGQVVDGDAGECVRPLATPCRQSGLDLLDG